MGCFGVCVKICHFHARGKKVTLQTLQTPQIENSERWNNSSHGVAVPSINASEVKIIAVTKKPANPANPATEQQN
jgi:hypothetical protein